MAEDGFVTRAVVFPLDLSPSEERLLSSYCGARRFAYNWVLATVKTNLEIRLPSVSFVEINHQMSWLHENRHAIRLMLPQSTPDPAVKRRRKELAWLHTTTSTRRLYRLVEQGRASIQKVTVAKRGGRWQASLLVRYQLDARPAVKPRKRHGATIGVDGGVKHLATLSRPVPGLTDEDGHVANPKVLDGQLRRLRKLDRAVARCEKGSRNRRRLLDRRARLHGRITKTRALHLHHLTNALTGGFDLVAIEDLNLAGMGNRKRRLGRALADASLGELRRQVTYKTADHATTLVAVGRFYPSSKTCSSCGLAKAKLALHERVFNCDGPRCAMSLDRDVNAARNIAREAERLLEHQQEQQVIAGLRPEMSNATPRPHKTMPSSRWDGSSRLRPEPSSPASND